MKKIAVPVLFALLINISLCHASEAKRQFKGSGEVVSVDPVYSQITILHGAITGFDSEGETNFYVADTTVLKNVSKGDLVDFQLTDTKGDVKIDRLEKTGIASPKEDGVPLGQAVQDTLQGTGQVLKAVTSPLPPVSEAIGGATDSASTSSDPRIQDGEVKQKIAEF